MIATARAARFLRSLPETDARRILDTLHAVTTDPVMDSPRVRKLAPNLWECRVTLAHRRQFRAMFGYRPDGEPVVLSALEKKDSTRHQSEIERARDALRAA